MSQEEIRIPGLYYTVIDGSFRTKVDQTHPQAVSREYETKDGAKAIKYERVVTSLSGYIEDIGIFESDYGKVINIKLDPNAEGKNPIVQLNTATTYGEDFLKKLPNIDLTKSVKIRPYAFTDEETGRDVRGVAITQTEGQDETKVQNFFYDSANKKAINGFPEPEGDTETYGNEDWKIHFLKARKFLIDYAQANIIPKLQSRPTRALMNNEEVINPEDIPF